MPAKQVVRVSWAMPFTSSIPTTRTLTSYGRPTSLSYPLSFLMTSGSPLSDDLRGVLVFMHISRSLDAKTISEWTGVPKRTVFRVLSNWRKTGGVKQASEEKRGRPRALDFADTKVRSTFLQQRSYRLTIASSSWVPFHGTTIDT